MSIKGIAEQIKPQASFFKKEPSVQSDNHNLPDFFITVYRVGLISDSVLRLGNAAYI